MFWSLENGILIGISCNLLFVLYSSARPKLNIEQQTSAGRYVYIVSPKTHIQFPAAEYLRKVIGEQCAIEGMIIVINGKNIGNMDATVARVRKICKSGILKRRRAKIIIPLTVRSGKFSDDCLKRNAIYK